MKINTYNNVIYTSKSNTETYNEENKESLTSDDGKTGWTNVEEWY